MDQKEVKAMQNIDHAPFMSNQQTIAHQPDKFVIDFKCIFMQFTPENNPLMVANHRVVLLDPMVAKDFLKILKENIERYEKRFGKIEKSKAVKVAEKEMKDMPKESTTGTVPSSPSYMG